MTATQVATSDHVNALIAERDDIIDTLGGNIVWEYDTPQWEDFEVPSDAECMLQDCCEALDLDHKQLVKLEDSELYYWLDLAGLAGSEELGHAPRAQWYQRAVAEAHRRQVVRRLTSLDRMKKYRSLHRPAPFSYEVYSEGYIDPVVAECAIRYPMGDVEVVDKDGKVRVLESHEWQLEDILGQMTAITQGGKVAERAEFLCRYPWNEEWAIRHEDQGHPERICGRVETGPLQSWAGSTWNVCTAGTHVEASLHYAVFVRTHEGTNTVVKQGRNDLEPDKKTSVWTWQYHYVKRFDTKQDALDFQDLVVNMIKRQRDFDSEGWEFTPGDINPWDPSILSELVANGTNHGVNPGLEGLDTTE